MKKIKDEERILKAEKEKQQIANKGTLIFQQKLSKPEMHGMIYLRWLKGKTYNQEYPTQQGSHSDFDGEIKSFTEKQNLKEFSTQPDLQ